VSLRREHLHFRRRNGGLLLGIVELDEHIPRMHDVALADKNPPDPPDHLRANFGSALGNHVACRGQGDRGLGWRDDADFG
jgi:hypothetical protein